MATCLSCARHVHDECYLYDFEKNICCCGYIDGIPPTTETAAPVGASDNDGREWYKQDEDVKDPKSTGRKRAAELYPLDREVPCEWRNLKYAGGGLFPIIGCSEGLQVHRHHGPDKNTLNNEPGNVHRICNECHACWHTNNDESYPRFAGTVMWSFHDAVSLLTSMECKGFEIAGRARASRDRFIWKAYTKLKDEPEPNALTDH